MTSCLGWPAFLYCVLFSFGGALASTGIRKLLIAGRGAAGLVKSGNKSNWQRLRIRLRSLIKLRRIQGRRLMSVVYGHTLSGWHRIAPAADDART